MQKASNIFLISTFVVLVCAFGFGTFFSQGTSFSYDEKRKLADCPRIKGKTLTVFPSKFESYASDRMAWRTKLIQARSNLKYEIWGVSGSPSVLVGNDQWLYFLGDGSAPVFRHEQPFSKEELERWKALLELRTKRCAEHGIKYVFVVAPDKPSIYPEYLPAGFRPVRPESRLDQLSAFLKGNDKLTFVNLSEALKAHKGEGKPLYLKTDTHWNHLGAYIGYTQLMRALNGWYPVLTPIASTQLKFTMSPYTQGDCLGLMGLFGAKQEIAPNLTKCGNLTFDSDSEKIAKDSPNVFRDCGTTNHKHGLKAVVLHDSFGDGLKPYLLQHFDDIQWIKQDELSFDEEKVLAAKPDILIQEMVERHVARYTPKFTENWKEWVANTIQKRADQKIYLSLLPNTPEVNATRLNQLAAMNVKAISCREWTETGDKVYFDEKTALYPQWYLLKTGDQGFNLLDNESEENYEALAKFITTSKHFVRASTLKLMDGSELQLYRQI